MMHPGSFIIYILITVLFISIVWESASIREEYPETPIHIALLQAMYNLATTLTWGLYA